MKKLFSGSFVDINISPGRVIFERDALSKVIELFSQLGDSFLLISTERCRDRLNLKRGYLREFFIPFSGEITEEEIDRISSETDSITPDFIVGSGGGKAIDCAKSVAFNMRKPFVAIPTSSATCASFTSLAVIYDEDGRFTHYRYMNTPPQITIIDNSVLSTAPKRLLASGIGDTIAKYVETISSVGETPTDLLSQYSLNIALDCLEIFDEINSPKKLIELSDEINFANIVLSGLSSGIGGMSCFATIAHALANGITQLKNSKNLLHGEMIAYTLLLEMIIEKFPIDEFNRIYNLFKIIGLPVSSDEIFDLSSISLDEEKMKLIYTHSQREDETALLARQNFTFKQLLEAFHILDSFNLTTKN